MIVNTGRHYRKLAHFPMKGLQIGNFPLQGNQLTFCIERKLTRTPMNSQLDYLFSKQLLTAVIEHEL